VHCARAFLGTGPSQLHPGPLTFRRAFHTGSSPTSPGRSSPASWDFSASSAACRLILAGLRSLAAGGRRLGEVGAAVKCEVRRTDFHPHVRLFLPPAPLPGPPPLGQDVVAHAPAPGGRVARGARHRAGVRQEGSGQARPVARGELAGGLRSVRGTGGGALGHWSGPKARTKSMHDRVGGHQGRNAHPEPPCHLRAAPWPGGRPRLTTSARSTSRRTS
jgi:hypothetical protein